MLRIGLTGGIGSGKSLVASVLEQMGYPVFYSDQEAKALYDTHQTLKAELIELIGAGLYNQTGFNKGLLSRAIFENADLLQNAILVVVIDLAIKQLTIFKFAIHPYFIVGVVNLVIAVWHKAQTLHFWIGQVWRINGYILCLPNLLSFCTALF